MKEYKIGDAVEELKEIENNSIGIVHLDDAWSRPNRGDEYTEGGQYGVNYPTHSFPKTQEVIEECYRVLKKGGWLIADADDWLMPRLVNYLRNEWGDAAANYRKGEGFRRVGGITYLTNNGDPSKGTAGMYLTNGGHHVIFAHKGETNRQTKECARQQAENYRFRNLEWDGIKPIKPYENWVEALIDPGETLLCPCAGTAPAVIGYENLYPDKANYIAIDIEEKAKKIFEIRKAKYLNNF